MPTIIDHLIHISVHKLSKWGYFNNYDRPGSLRWSRNGKETSSIGVFVSAENNYIELKYLRSATNEKVNYKVYLIDEQSNLGKGKVYYFICPITGNRCRKLYLYGKYFMSRKAIPNAMYESQTRSKRWRQWEKTYGKLFKQDKWFKEINSKHFKKYYNGKPTKRYKKLWLKIQSVPEIEPNEISRLLIG